MNSLFNYLKSKLNSLVNKTEVPVSNHLFLDVLKAHLEDRALRRQLSSETKRKYRFCYEKIEKYLSLHGMKNLTIDKVRVPIFEDLRRWMHAPGNAKSCGLTHSSRHLEICIGAMDYAVRMEYIKYNPLAALETGRDKRKSVIHLTKEELQRFMHYRFKNKTFQKVQDLYTFQAVTGISYCDLYSYSVKSDIDSGIEWIEDRRNKTGKSFFVPLSAPGFEIAKAIHKKYNGRLPKMENGSYNRLLKEMAAVLEINKNITSHTARKTCATLLDQEGFSLGVISAILGNTEEICRDHYIEPTRKKIEKAFNEKYNQAA